MDVTEERADPERAWQPPAAQLPPVTEERDDGGDRPRRSDRRGRRKPGRGGVQLLSGLSGQRHPYPLAELTQRQPAVSGGVLQRFHRRLPGPLCDGQNVLALDGLIPGVRSHAPSGAHGGAAPVDVRWRADETSLATGIPGVDRRSGVRQTSADDGCRPPWSSGLVCCRRGASSRRGCSKMASAQGQQDLHWHLEINDGGRTVAVADVTTSYGADRTAWASLRTVSGHIPPGIRVSLVDAVLDLPQVQDSARLKAAFPLGDSESLRRLQQRCENVTVHPAGASALLEASIRPGGSGACWMAQA